MAYESNGQRICQRGFALALAIITTFAVLTAAASLDGLWLNRVAAADGGGGSTVPIPPPNRPTPRSTESKPSETSIPPDRQTPQITDIAPSKTPTPTGELVTPTSTEMPNRESGRGTTLALGFGIGLGAISLVGLAIGAFIFVSSRGPGSST